jgi:hypothetical protein
MQQELVDSSKYRISLVSLDTRFASQIACNKGEFKIKLPRNMKNVMRIRMASSEIPLVAYVFSEDAGNTTFAVRVGLSETFTKCPPIPEGNYQCAKHLMAAIQKSLQEVHPGFTCTYNALNGRVTIANSSVTFELYLISYNKKIASRLANWGIGYNLGFRSGRVKALPATGGAFSVTGESLLNIQAAPYYLLELKCPDAIENVTHPVMDNGYVNAFAKLVLKNNAYTFNFDDNSNLLRKEFTFLAPTSVPFFNIRLMDGYGETVNMQFMDWSITIEVTEVVNSKTYADISNTYSRDV